jgi:hypothetical protein
MATKKAKEEASGIDDLLLGQVAEDQRPKAIDDEKLAGLTELVNQTRQIEEQIAALNDQVKARSERLRILKQIEIPETMDSLGVAQIKTTTGLVVTVKDDLKASISKERQAEAYQWLEDNGCIDIVKSEVVVGFDRGTIDNKRKFCEFLAKKGLPYQDKETIHWQTLRAFVKEQLEQGANLPMEAFGVFQFREAVIK